MHNSPHHPMILVLIIGGICSLVLGGPAVAGVADAGGHLRLSGSPPASGPAACVQPPSGVIAWWSFDETSGNIAADRTGNNPGAWTNGPVPAAGEVRGAYRFNGSSYVTVQDSPLWQFGGNDFSIELWANFASAPGGAVGEPAAILVANDEGPDNRNKWFFAVGGGYLYFHINGPQLGPQFFPLVPFTPVVGQWYHLAVVRTGSTFTVYVNGVASGTATNVNAVPAPNAPLTMAEGEGIGFLNGLLDEVAIYSRGLQPEEIAAIYGAGHSGKCESLQMFPSAGGDTGSVSVSITGTGFQSGAAVSLSMTGQAAIAGSAVAVANGGTTIAAAFDLAGQADGAWDVVVTNPDGTSQTLPQGFTVKPGTDPQVWVNIVGLGLIVPGRPQTLQVFYGNRGNVDAVGVPLWFAGIPADATLQQGFSVVPPPPLTAGADYSQIPSYVSTGTQLESGLLIPLVPAGSTGALQLSITVPELEDFQLQAWTNPPWFGGSSSPGSSAVPARELPGWAGRGPGSHRSSALCQARRIEPADSFGSGGLIDCAVAIAGELFSLSPASECVKSVVGAYQEGFTALAEERHGGSPTLVNLPLAFFDVFNQCVVSPALCAVCLEGDVPACLPCWRGLVIANATALYSAFGTLKTCVQVDLQLFNATKPLKSVGSLDPNNKVGPQGAGDPGWVSGQQPLSYSVVFENLPSASAPAQQVVVTDQLDATKVDLSTLSLGPIFFGGNQVFPPPAASTFATEVDLRPAADLIVKVNANADPNTGLLTWRFQSIDPATGNPPLDPETGFLPPDTAAPAGEGGVLFTVSPLQGTSTGTAVSNQATITFDTNAPLATPVWTNTLDVDPPVSHVAPLAATQGVANFAVQWSGSDVGAGVRDYTLFVADDGGAFVPFLSNVTATSTTFTGQDGHTYGFYSLARDWAGNLEAAKTAAEATTVVALDTVPPVTSAALSPAANGNGWNNTNVVINLTATDSEQDGTGVKQITYSAAGAQTVASTVVAGPSASLTVSSEGTTTVTFFATDNAGNIESPKEVSVKIDKTPPTISGSFTPAANANGWNNSAVTVSFTCSDSLSGLAPGSPPAATVLTAEGANQSATGTCSDLAGNLAAQTVRGINIDRTPPAVVCSASPNLLWPPNGKLVPVNVTVKISDGLSGPGGFVLNSVTSSEPESGAGDIQGFVTGTASTSGELRAERLGTGSGRLYTFTYTGMDRAGNAAQCKTEVEVPKKQKGKD